MVKGKTSQRRHAGAPYSFAARTIQNAWRSWSRRRGMRFGMPSMSGSDKGILAATAANIVSRFGSRTSHGSKITTGKIVGEGTGGQYSSFSLKNKLYFDESVNKALAPYKAVFNDAQQVKSAVGKQNVALAMTGYDKADLTTLYTDINGAGTASRMLVKKMNGTVHMSNCYLGNVTVDIYDIVARKDGPSSIGNALSAWSVGDTDESIGSFYQKVGSTPFQTEVFNDYFKVLQTTRVVLGAGQMHKHHVNLDLNRIMTYSYLTYTAGCYRDLTYNCLVVVRGAPANDVATHAIATLGAGGLNIVFEKEYTSTVLFNNIAALKDHSNLPTTGGDEVVDVGGTTIVTNALG